MTEEKEEKKEKRLFERLLSPKKEEDEQSTIIDRLRSGNGPIRDFFKQSRITEETLSNEQQNLAKAFREGIAEAIGIPVDHISETSVIRWILEFTRSFVKPENLKDTIVPPDRRLRMFGHEIGTIVRQAIEKLDEKPKAETLIEKVTKRTTEIVEEPKERDRLRDISLG